LTAWRAPPHHPGMGRKRVRFDPRAWYSLGCWVKRRDYQLRCEPLCEQCHKEGRITAAVVADHVRPCKDDWVEFRTGALQSLCFSCHDRKTRAERGFRPRFRFDVHGDPLPVPDWHKDADDDIEDDEDDEDVA
jgi:hypothetical protein